VTPVEIVTTEHNEAARTPTNLPQACEKHQVLERFPEFVRPHSLDVRRPSAEHSQLSGAGASSD
jgi:hypothetical protein